MKRGGERLNMADKEMKTITDLSCWLRIHVVTERMKLNNKVACRQSEEDLIIFKLPILDEEIISRTKRIKYSPDPGLNYVSDNFSGAQLCIPALFIRCVALHQSRIRLTRNTVANTT